MKQETVSKSNHLWRRNRAEAAFSGVAVVIVFFQSFSPAQWDPYCIPKGWELGKAGTGTDTIWGGGVHLPILSPPNGWMAGGRSPPLEKDFGEDTQMQRDAPAATLSAGATGAGSVFSCALSSHLFLRFLISSQSHCKLYPHSRPLHFITRRAHSQSANSTLGHRCDGIFPCNWDCGYP